VQANVGGADRIVRVVAGLGVLTWGVLNHSWWGALGLVFLGTAAIGWCPLYVPFGLSSCRVKKG